MTSLELITPCLLWAQNNPGAGQFFFIPMLLIGVLFYFMFIRSEGKKRNEVRQMQQNLKKNDQIVTIGGIFGTVVNTPKDSEDVTIRVDDNTRIRIQRSAIARVLSDDQDAKKDAKSDVA